MAREPKWNLFVDGPQRATIGCSVCTPIPFFYCAKAMAKGSIMSVLISILITFLVIILVLYLINMLPLDGRAKQIARVVVIILGVISLLKYIAVI